MSVSFLGGQLFHLEFKYAKHDNRSVLMEKPRFAEQSAYFLHNVAFLNETYGLLPWKIP